MYDFDFTYPVNYKHIHAKLTQAKAQEIRERYATGKVTQQQLAKQYSVSQNAICRIVNGKTWKDGGQDDG